MRRTLMTGIRQAGEERFHFNVHGRADNELPPARFKASLNELAHWLNHGGKSADHGGEFSVYAADGVGH